VLRKTLMASPSAPEVTMITAMTERIPVVTLLSHAFVAYTIEFDNEAEHRLQHRTTQPGGKVHSPWLVSMAMWFNCMQFLDENGLPVAELFRRARTRTNLDGMRRWGYVTITADPSSGKPKASSGMVRPTDAGLEARNVWQPIFKTMEERWNDRFGEPETKQLRWSIGKLADQFDVDLPDCLPILGYGLTSSGHRYGPRTSKEAPYAAALLPILFARILLAFALVYEKKSELSLAISANVIRVLGEKSIRTREIPQLAGVSKEAVRMALNYLTKRGFATVSKEQTASRGKVARLTKKGREARDLYHVRLCEIEKGRGRRFGDSVMSELREAIETIVGRSTAEPSRLFLGLEPYPGNWRARIPKPRVLPHFPMVLHRGGYPDGS